MKDKIVIVTGANAGMGLATVTKLAAEGAHVIMACRSRERGETALAKAKTDSGSDRIELMLCDLGSLESIRAFAEAYRERFQTLDVLINNAGVVAIKRQTTSDGFESMIGINHLGHFLLTNLLLEPLTAAPQGRIINVSSGAHKWGRIHWDDPNLQNGYNVVKGYGQSKLANILFTRELADRLKGTNVTANSLHPGAVSTQIGIDRKTGFGKSVHALLRPFFLTPDEGAQTAIYLASSPEVARVSGNYFIKSKPATVTDRASDKQEAVRLWTWSEQQVGLT
ncbi:SDR family oxidoreductase [Paenibacillus daejeonensis]|uniref:SDR family oxidoreductase n=1 Tax=Paenibacillus daejeonensis TaxID=135193 RepID=UPI00037CA479|nr:SDR family oxidoreductase [Paenibacillus daejeonensis]